MLTTARAARPNVFFLAIDDLNDWIEPLGGYPGVLTPNLNRLAGKCCVFERAYTTAPSCSPARSAVMFGVQPFNSGVYTKGDQWNIGSGLTGGQTSLPRYMRANGYTTIGAGKVFHAGWRRPGRTEASDPGAWDHYEFFDQNEGHEDEMAFGVIDQKTSSMPDVIRSKWYVENVLSKSHDKPLFAAFGLKKPHGPFMVPQQWFDLYDPASVRYPPGVLDSVNHRHKTNADIADLPVGALKLLKRSKVDHAAVLANDDWLNIVRAYLATISFTDFCIGMLLDGLLNGPNAANTIIVLWSDHGWQLGEKLGWRKFTLWERATHVPLMIGGPDIRPGVCGVPVSTVSLFPTISDLAFGRAPGHNELGPLPLDGASLKPLLDGTGESSSGFALSTWKTKSGHHFSVRTENHRMIAYGGDGGFELYDHRTDPYEFHNLMHRPTPEAEAITAQMMQSVPAVRAPSTIQPEKKKKRQTDVSSAAPTDQGRTDKAVPAAERKAETPSWKLRLRTASKLD